MPSRKSIRKGARPAAKKTPARAAKANAPYKLTPLSASVALSVKAEGVEAILGAAYLMMDQAYVSLAGDHKTTLTVTLRPKNPKAVTPKALAEEFLADLASQKVRWAIAKNNQPVREFIAEQAVVLANNPAPAAAPAAAEPAAEQLTDDQRAEIEKLIAEVEGEIKAMNDAKAKPAAAQTSAADPKNIKASWEEKQERENPAA